MPGGLMIIVVPHEDLYEQGFWPSLYNLDHKVTFRLDADASWSPRSYDLRRLAKDLPGAEIASANVQDHGHRYDWRPGIGRQPRKLGSVRRLVSRMGHSALKRVRNRDAVAEWMNPLLARRGVPIDQTHSGALAQVECVVQKKIS